MSISRSPYLVLFAVSIFCQAAASHSDQQSVDGANTEVSIAHDGTVNTLNTDHFSVVCVSRPADGEKIACLLELAYRHFELLFKSHDFELRTPENKLRWIAFGDTASFNLYAIETEGQDLSWLTGYYSGGTNAVAIVTPERISKWQIKAQASQPPNVIACPPDAETGLVKLVHEAGHQLSFNTGLLKRRVMYPMWATEGLAMFFERSLVSEYFNSCRYTNLRAQRLARLYRRGQLIGLNKLISMSRADEDANAIDVYAQAWGLFQFLCEKRRDSLRQYLSNLYELKPGWRSEQTLRIEFVRAFGPIEQIDPQWTQFLRTLPAR
jgi:hypothetical protein